MQAWGFKSQPISYKRNNIISCAINVFVAVTPSQCLLWELTVNICERTRSGDNDIWSTCLTTTSKHNHSKPVLTVGFAATDGVIQKTKNTDMATSTSRFATEITTTSLIKCSRMTHLHWRPEKFAVFCRNRFRATLTSLVVIVIIVGIPARVGQYHWVQGF